jgi:hypothetical protein
MLPLMPAWAVLLADALLGLRACGRRRTRLRVASLVTARALLLLAAALFALALRAGASTLPGRRARPGGGGRLAAAVVLASGWLRARAARAAGRGRHAAAHAGVVLHLRHR